jgi:hypothetical protein
MTHPVALGGYPIPFPGVGPAPKVEQSKGAAVAVLEVSVATFAHCTFSDNRGHTVRNLRSLEA